MKRTLWLFLIVLLWASPALAAPASSPALRLITNTDPDFGLRLPANFKEYPGKWPGGAMFLWEQYDGQGRKTGVFVEIEKVPELPQVSPDRIDLPPSVERLYTEKWQGWDIDVYVLRTRSGDQAMITRNAAVPLKGAGLKLQVTGPESADAQMNVLLKDLLAGLEGQTNWMRHEDHTLRTILSAAGFATALAAVAVVILLRRQHWKKRREHSANAAMHAPK